MKLLIVDDQKSVVDGLMCRVDWPSISVTETFGASDTAQARAVLLGHDIDVLLCDIEMPSEDGLSLIDWIRQSGMRTRCILLTAHAEFSYAQRSLSLGAFDYIVQPAPYGQIRAAVERAVKDIENERSEEYRTTYDRLSEWRRGDEVAQKLERYLQTGENCAEIVANRYLPEDKPMFLAYLQILRWNSYDEWAANLLSIMLGNAVSDVFSKCGQTSVIVPIDKETFAFLIWSDHNTLTAESVANQFGFLYNICRQRLKCTVALYQRGPHELTALPDAWRELAHSLQSSGARQGETAQKPQGGMASAFHVPEIGEWLPLLEGERPSQFAARLEAYINPQNPPDEDSLHLLYEDLLHAFHAVTGDGAGFWRELLVDSDSYETYRCGMRSAAQLLALARMATRHMESVKQGGDEELVGKVKRYIEEHLDSDIHRSDLAAQFYLNPDYLNRLFKKQSGCTLKEYIIRYKMNEARKLLRTTSLPVSIIAAKVGYVNFSHFSYTYKKALGQSPMESRQSGEVTREEGEPCE